MWPACRTWRQKFARLNLWATLYGSWALGLFPFIYNSSTKKLRRSTWLIGYGIILQVGFVWVTHNYQAETDTTALIEVFHRNPLAEQINYLQNLLLLTTVFVMHFRNWWLSEELASTINTLTNLYQQHLNPHDFNDCLSFDNYIIYKGLSIWLEVASMFVMRYGLSPPISFKLFLGLVGVMAVQMSILLIGMHFHLAVLYIYRSVWIVNRELLTLANQLRMWNIRSSPRVQELHCLYSRLLGLSNRLGALYDYQMTLFMISLLSVNILSIFYMIVYCISLKKILTFALAINFIQALAINLMDFWLSIAVCDLAERQGRATSAILKLFNDIPELEVDLDRSINDFALFCCHRRLRFNHCGLFYVHNAMGFRMIVACVLYLIYLVQFDYMNL
ncbi:gustatory receptor for bitter taste 22e [Drosophila virilis]|nr:gustatory receptor for bitter taste 22e [Drosophila virilis]XP_032293974.1 gustatory receptor for bitter taste 22e [Drosophila virilis]XP_032293975.1 gustatory receptor for bitter taste 22e [Drosophila virilis]